MEEVFDGKQLLKWFLGPFSDQASNADLFVRQTTDKVGALMKRDYEVVFHFGDVGLTHRRNQKVVCFPQDLCPSYPPTLFLLNVGSSVTQDDFCLASHARARTRFAVPVLVVNGKHLARSATLSVSGEAALNAVSAFFSPKNTKRSSGANPPSRETSMVGRNREADVNLLKKLGITTIFDLMKEQRKKKYGVVVASSEKVDSLHRYDHMQLCGVPFPGTEGFVKFSDHEDVNAAQFERTSDEDALVFFHEKCHLTEFDWSQHHKWGLKELTINYLRVMLCQFRPESPGGILIHW